METPADDEQPFYCLGGCGNRLTSSESLATGYGRVCAERHGIDTRTPPKLGRPTRARPGPGQDELPLTDQLDLWEP